VIYTHVLNTVDSPGREQPRRLVPAKTNVLPDARNDGGSACGSLRISNSTGFMTKEVTAHQPRVSRKQRQSKKRFSRTVQYKV